MGERMDENKTGAPESIGPAEDSRIIYDRILLAIPMECVGIPKQFKCCQRTSQWVCEILFSWLIFVVVLVYALFYKGPSFNRYHSLLCVFMRARVEVASVLNVHVWKTITSLSFKMIMCVNRSRKHTSLDRNGHMSTLTHLNTHSQSFS